MGSSSSRNVEASQGSHARQRCRRERSYGSDACLFGRRHNSEKRRGEKNCVEPPSASSSSTSRKGSRDCGGEGTIQLARAFSPECVTGEISVDRDVELDARNQLQVSRQEVEVSVSTSSSDSKDSEDEEESDVDDNSSLNGGGAGQDVKLHTEVSTIFDGESSSSASTESEVDEDAESRGRFQERSSDSAETEQPASVATDDEPGPLRTGESRRTSGRRFWDALTRAASHRRNNSPITIVAIEEIDDNGSSTSMWNFQHWRAAADQQQNSSRGATDLEERRRHVRSHVWALQRLSGGLQVSRAHERSCPAAGENIGGLCSCDAANSGSEDSSTRASISRIIMLAEALFEVLDEIHRQSVALSRSATMPLSSLPAPDEVVDSFPLRFYHRTVCEEAAQCHICLVEYEEGDEMRVLPCHHEYHKACVDKWLKEVHRVCPLCRGDVCDPALNNSESVSA